MKFMMLMGILSFFGLAQASEPIAVGAKAPEVSAPDENGATVNLAEVYKKGLTLVYFYPKADTPGCTAEACSLRDAFVEISQKGIQVVGVSTDKPEAQKKFKDKYHLPFTLLADSDKKVTEAFGVPTTLGFAARQSFLIKDGVVVWEDLKASTAKQAQDILAAAAKL